MVPRISKLIAAGFGALSLAAGAAVYADDAPLSVNETGPVSANHQMAPTESASATGRSGYDRQAREVRGGSSESGTYEVQTPSSVNESAPWLTGQDRWQGR